jgi:outer membrane receptor for ferrienterochelin and colicins
MIRLLILLVLGVIITWQAVAQEHTDAMLFGDIKSSSTNEHIPFATIMVKGTNMGTVADFTGHFKLAHLPEGQNTIIARAVGYKSQELDVLMERDKAVTLFFELEEDILNLEQFVVTGTRTQRFVKDVPVRTEVIGIQEIENKNAWSLYEALNGTPGLRVENQCQSCNFTMVRMQGLGAEHTQVLINGQPMYSGLAGVYGLQQMSTVDIGRIEVVKGAGSALYGSGAVAGAINIITKEPGREPSTDLDIQFGNYGTNRYGISSSLRNKKGNIGVNIFAQKLTEGAIDETGPGLTREEVEQKDGYTDRVATNLTTAGFGLYVDNVFFERDKLVLRGKTITEQRQGGLLENDYYKNPFTDGTERIVTDRYEAQMSYNKKIGHRSELDFTFAYVNHKRDATNDSYLSDFMAVHNDSLPDLRDMRPYLADEHSLTSSLTYGTILSNHHLLVGVQIHGIDLVESGMYMVVNPDSDFLGQGYRSVSKKKAREIGMFVQDEWTVNSRLTLVPGVRIDNHSSEENYTADRQVFQSEVFPTTTFDQTTINPRLAVKYDMNKNIVLRANVGSGFRAPYGFAEDLHLCSGSPRVWKSSELNPETSISYNFSADFYSNNTRTTVNVFRTDLRNKIDFANADAEISALGFDYQWENVDDAFVQGIEISFIANLSRVLDLGVDLTFNQGEYKSVREDWVETEYEEISKNISRFPATTGNLKIEYRPGTWTLALFGDYMGNMYIDYFNEEVDPELGDLTKIKKTDPFMLFNTRIAKQFNQFRLYTGVNNIFNYIQDERHLDDPAFIYAPVYGTLFYGGISLRL